jgi:hypothetical protein
MDDRTRGADVARDSSGRPVDEPQTVGTKAAVTAPAGAVAGAAAGAAAGTVTAGPVGTIIGALVGAVGGGLAGLGAADEAQPTADDEEYYRTHHRGATSGLADAAYERARPAYHLGHVAALNPDWRGRRFEEVEPELRRAWSDDVRARHGEWSAASPFARAAYERALSRTNAGPGTVPVTDAPVGTTRSHDHASFSDPLPPSADVAGTASDPRPLAGAPEHSSGGGDPLEHGSLSDQGGFGTHLAPDAVRRSDARRDDERHA